MELVGRPHRPLLWVVRHGESTWNAIGRMQREVAHPPLTARGTTQAYAAGYTLRNRQIDRIVCSDAVRAVQTAHAMATVLGVESTVDPSTRQWRTGTDVPNGAVVGVGSPLSVLSALSSLRHPGRRPVARARLRRDSRTWRE